MQYHQLMSLFAAPIGNYYPKHEGIIAAQGWGASTVFAGSLFDGNGKDALIRSIMIPPTTITTGTLPIVKLLDASGNTMLQWTLRKNVSSGMLAGIEGFLVPGGFSLSVSAAGSAFVAVVYDAV